MGRVISTAIQFIDGFTKPSKAVIKSMQQMGNNTIKTAKQIQNAGRTITNVGSSLSKTITLPITGIATAAVKTAADFEAAMSEVGAISNATTKDITILTAKAKEMGAITKFSASESAEAMKYMAMAGWKTTDMTEGIAGIMNLAAASGESLGTTSDIVTDALTAFGMAAGESGRFADVLAATSTNANTNVSMMGESFKYCAATAGAMKYSVEDISVALGTMANAGIKGSTAGTTLKNVIANLAKPTKSQEVVMKKLGISLTDNNGNMKSFMGVMENLRKSFNGLTETEKASYATTLAGKESMSGLLTILNTSTKDFNKLTEAINGSKGTAEEMSKKMLDNLNGQLTLLKSAIETIAITIGNTLLPYMKRAVEWIQKAADYINNLSDAQVRNIMKWASIAASIGPAIMIFGKVITTIGKVQKTFGQVTKTVANFGGIINLITSPAGHVIIILAAIATAALLVIKNWSKVKNFLSSVKSWFNSAFEGAGTSVEKFKSKFTSIKNTIGKITVKIGGIFKSIGKLFKKEFSGEITEGASGIKNGFKTIVIGTVNAFDSITNAIDKGLKVFDALLSFFTGAFSGNWNTATKTFKDTLKNIFPENIANNLISAFDKALPIIKAVTEGIKSTFDGLIQDAKKIFGNFKTIFGGIGTFLKGIFSGDTKTALKGLKTAVTSVHSVLDIVGNSFKTKLNAIKDFVVKVLSNFFPEGTVSKIAGIFDHISSAWDIAISTAKDVINSLKPLFNDFKTIFGGISKFVKGIVSGDWSGAWDGLKTIANGAASGLVNLIKAPFTVIKKLIKRLIGNFKGFNGVKKIFSSFGNAIKKVLLKCGFNFKQFNTTINNIKTRIGKIIGNLRTIFSTVFDKIGKVVKKVASVFTNIFGKKISNTCSTTKSVIMALKIVINGAFNFISEVIKKAMNIIVPVIKVAFIAIKNSIAFAVQTITSIISGLMTIFDGITTFISGVFTGNWKKAWEGVKTIFKGIFETFSALCKAPINAVITLINTAISGINKLGLTIPDWIPFIGGKSFSINIPTIPMLYKGTKNWQGGAAMIHDRGGEIVDLPKGSRVYPHDKSIEMVRKEEAAKSGTGSISVVIQKLADKIEIRNDKDIDRIVTMLVAKLRKVAFNSGG